MWLRLENGNYELVENGTVLTARGDNVKGYHVGIMRPNTYPPVTRVQDGYSTLEDAQAALDELMDSEDVSRIQPPVTPEETHE